MNEDAKCYLILSVIPGLGPIGISRLVERFGCAKNIFQAKDELNGFLNKKQLSLLKSDEILRQVDKIESISKKKGIKIISLSDVDYPSLLKTIPDPPPVLYTIGTLQDDLIRIAMVGSRLATFHSISIAERISEGLSMSGLTVVSGFARGIDTAAHRGAVRFLGKTVAVMGCGVDVIYPRENKELYHKIMAQNGAIISEFPPQTPPLGINFPKRNRIISGISIAVIIVQAAHRSGSLITARLALEQGREVFTVPGPGGSEKYKGSNDLIRQGARIVENSNDVLEEIKDMLTSYNIVERKGEDFKDTYKDDPVLNLLSEEPVYVDTLREKLKINIPQLNEKLFELEIKGLVKKLPGGMYIALSNK